MQGSESEQSFHQSDFDEPDQRSGSISRLAKAKVRDEEEESHHSEIGYQAPNQDLNSDCQLTLETFKKTIANHEDGFDESNQRRDQDGIKSESDEDVRHDQSTGVDQLGILALNAPKDATGCNKIKSMDEYIKQNRRNQVRNPRNTFFETSREYYNSKYSENKKRTIIVKSYLILETHDNFVKDLSMEIIQTNQGCMPIIKTFEYDSYNKGKFKKALKFYKYRTNCDLIKQIVVDEGVMHDNFRCYDTSLLHFGNSIIFYKREENWHKLQKFDVTTSQLEEIPGYQIAEPIGDEIRYHLMFSVEFGRQKTSTEIAEQKLQDIHEFLADKIVVCQAYQINERLECITKPLQLRRMCEMKDDQYGKRAIEQFVDTKRRVGDPKQSSPLEAIQFILHTWIPDPDDVTGTQSKQLFIALDPFNAHHFTIDKSGNTFSAYTTYVGNNETQMQMIEHLKNDQFGDNLTQQEKDRISNWRHSKIDGNSIYELLKPNSGGYCFQNYEFPEYDENFSKEYNKQLMNSGKWKYAKPPPDERVARSNDPEKQEQLEREKQHELEEYQKEKNLEVNVFNPFLKHQNPQFIIQKEKVVLNKGSANERNITQYYYITNDNEYMLIYPNYQDESDKQDVLFQIAKKFQYGHHNDDEEYHYIDDYDQRRKDYRRAIYKKISHVCNEDYRSKNHIKRAEHLRNILDYERDLNINDKVLLSTDQERSNIYVYQSNVVTGRNEINIYNYENNIAWRKKATSLAEQIYEIEQDQLVDHQPYQGNLVPPQKTYYVNANYKHMVHNAWSIKTQMILRDINENTHVTHKIYEPDRYQNIIVEKQTTPGEYINIIVKKDKDIKNEVIFQMYNKNRNYYTFFFAMRNKTTQQFFALRKTVDEVEAMGYDNKTLALIERTSEITVIKENKFENACHHKQEEKNSQEEDQEEEENQEQKENQEVSTRMREQLKAYTEVMTVADLVKRMKGDLQTYRVHLTFEKCYDNRSNLDFIPIIYQDNQCVTSHHLIVFDAERLIVTRHTMLASTLPLRKVLKKNDQGFGIYNLTRTSDVHDQKIGLFTNKIGVAHPSTQKVKYQVCAMYALKEVNAEFNRRHTMMLSTARKSAKKPKQNMILSDDNPAQSTTEAIEYVVTFSNCERNRIQMVGKKQFLLSQVARAGRGSSFKELFMIPYFDRNGFIKGSRLVLYSQNPECQHDENAPEIILEQINIKDQELNNIYHQQNDLIQFGHQKFLINKDSHEEYILIVSCQFKRKVYMEANFENSEAYWVLSKIQKKLMSMQLAKFEYFVLNDDFDELMREEFYQGQEVLEGKTINDLCLNFPKEVQHGILKDPSNVGNIRGSLADELCENNQDLLDDLLELNLCEYNLLIQVDFNLCTSLRIAMELNSNQSVKILLEKIFQLNDIKYQELLMIDLSRFLQLPRVERLYDFLERDYEEMVEIERKLKASQASNSVEFLPDFLNFEDFMNHPDLPPYSDALVKYHVKEYFRDFHAKKGEVIEEILEREGKYEAGADEYLSETRKTNIEVEHSSIDFSIVIIGDKARSVLENNYKLVNFNDQALANLMFIEDDEHIAFYGLEVIRKIIDFQFETTRTFLGRLCFLYVVGFFIPFFFELSTDSIFLKNISYLVCFFTQVFFLLFEIIQVKEQKLDYFLDLFNWFDFSQFFVFIFLWISKVMSQFKSHTMVDISLQTILLVMSFWKLLYFMRVRDDVLKLTTTAYYIFIDIIPFITMASVALLGFMKISSVIKMGVNDPSGEFDSINSYGVKMAFMQYESANGQKRVPILSHSMFDEVKNSFIGDSVLMGMSVSVWLAQNSFFAFMGVIFTAQLYQAFEKVYPKLANLAYKSKAKYNCDNFQILNVFKKQRSFKVLAFQMAKSLRGASNMDYEGIIKTAHKHQVNAWRKAAGVRKTERENAEKCYKETIAAQNGQVQCIREANRIREQLTRLQTNIQSGRRCCCEIRHMQ